MPHQPVFPVKTLRALLTLKLLHSGMLRLKVLLQVAPRRKLPMAHFTLEILLVETALHVGGQMAPLPERFAAVVAPEALFSRVNQYVVVEVGDVIEHFVAELALVVLLRVVHGLPVVHQGGLLLEPGVANVTLVEFLLSVDEHVHLQAGPPRKPLAAPVAP